MTATTVNGRQHWLMTLRRRRTQAVFTKPRRGAAVAAVCMTLGLALPLAGGALVRTMPGGGSFLDSSAKPPGETAPAPFPTGPGISPPLPTHKMYSSLFWRSLSTPLFFHPMAAQCDPGGLSIAAPTVVGAGEAIYGSYDRLMTLGVPGGPSGGWSDCVLDKYSDFSITIGFPSGSGSTGSDVPLLRTTHVQGSPQLWALVAGSTAMLSFRLAAAVFGSSSTPGVAGVGISTAGKAFGVFGPAGTTFSLGAAASGTANTAVLTISLAPAAGDADGTPRYLSVMLLPAATQTMLDAAAAVALSPVVEARVEWAVDRSTSQVTTIYHFGLGRVATTTPAGATVPSPATFAGLYPHQWRSSAPVTPFTGVAFPSVRGPLKVARLSAMSPCPPVFALGPGYGPQAGAAPATTATATPPISGDNSSTATPGATGAASAAPASDPKTGWPPLLGCVSFSITQTYPGILPYVPPIAHNSPLASGGSHTLSQLKLHVQSVADEAGGDHAFGARDTYFLGKSLQRAANVIPLAQAVGLPGVAASLMTWLNATIADFLTVKGDGSSAGADPAVFWLDGRYGSLVGYPASFGSNTELNDHYFHYGYIVGAAALLALRDPNGFPKAYGGMVDALVAEIANHRRGGAAGRDGYPLGSRIQTPGDALPPPLPYLRHFDIYSGHSWASGHANFLDGNNQESLTEAMNAWAGVITWGAATGNDAITNAGMWLYTQEAHASAYWFDFHKGFAAGYSKNYASMIWGGKGGYQTWFTDDIQQKRGINILPVAGGSHFAVRSPAYCLDFMRETASDFGGSRKWLVWRDVLWSYQAMCDAPGALSLYNADVAPAVAGKAAWYPAEQGDSAAHTYAWLHAHAALGVHVQGRITADTPLYGVFEKHTGTATGSPPSADPSTPSSSTTSATTAAVMRSYVATNTKAAPLTVTFSDGLQLLLPPRATGWTSRAVPASASVFVLAASGSGGVPIMQAAAPIDVSYPQPLDAASAAAQAQAGSSSGGAFAFPGAVPQPQAQPAVGFAGPYGGEQAVPLGYASAGSAAQAGDTYGGGMGGVGLGGGGQPATMPAPNQYPAARTYWCCACSSQWPYSAGSGTGAAAGGRSLQALQDTATTTTSLLVSTGFITDAGAPDASLTMASPADAPASGGGGGEVFVTATATATPAPTAPGAATATITYAPAPAVPTQPPGAVPVVTATPPAPEGRIGAGRLIGAILGAVAGFVALVAALTAAALLGMRSAEKRRERERAAEAAQPLRGAETSS